MRGALSNKEVPSSSNISKYCLSRELLSPGQYLEQARCLDVVIFHKGMEHRCLVVELWELNSESSTLVIHINFFGLTHF